MLADPKTLRESNERRLTLYELHESEGMNSLSSMEGVWSSSSFSTVLDNKKVTKRWIGIVSAIVITVLAYWVNQLPFAPFTMKGAALEHPVGVSALCIILGVIVANSASVKSLQGGCRWITKWCIPAAVVALGAGLNVSILAEVGWVLITIILLLVFVAIIVAYGLGRTLGLSNQAAYLLGVGTAICGSSAILATSQVSGADDDDILVTVGAVNLIGLLAMFSCVGMLYLVPLDAKIFGAWVGATIHAVPQVIAAGESHSVDATALGSLVKLVRVTLLAPVVMLTALFVAKGNKEALTKGKKGLKLFHYVPWFVWGFLGLAIAREIGWLPSLEFTSQDHGVVRISVSELLLTLAKWLLAISMAAIGLQVRIRPMLKIGFKVMTTGVVAWLAMSALALSLFSLAL